MRPIQAGDLVDVLILPDPETHYQNARVISTPDAAGIWQFKRADGAVVAVSALLAIVTRFADHDRQVGGQDDIASDPVIVR